MTKTSSAQMGQPVPPSTSPAFSLEAGDEAKIRAAAEAALRRALPILAEERVIPRSRYRPWIWMARDYFGHAVEGSRGALSKALESSLPDRFGEVTRPSLDHPWGYAAALLEAAVAAATRAGEPYDLRSPSVQRAIDGLIEKVQSTPASTVLQLVSDIDLALTKSEGTDADLGETIEISNVRVIRVGNEAERFIEQEIPGAGLEVDRTHAVVHPGPAALLVARVEQLAHYSARATEGRRRLAALLTSIRLATGSSSRVFVDVEGEPEQVRWVSPSVTPMPVWKFRFVYRPALISPLLVPGLSALASLIRQFDGEATVSVGVRVALGRLVRSLDTWSPSLVDPIVDLAIGLEAALAGTDRTEVGLRLRTRAAGILAADGDPPDSVYRDVRTLYELRSAIVHGGSLSQKEFDKAVLTVAGVSPAQSRAEQQLIAVDRWRDLLRRAVLARIALETAHVPWARGPSKKALDIDQLLLLEEDRNSWREHIRAFWDYLGLPEAVDPLGPPRLWLGAANG